MAEAHINHLLKDFSAPTEIRQITPEYLSEKTDSDLMTVHLWVHQLWEKCGIGNHPHKDSLKKAHTFSVREIDSRGLRHRNNSDLDDESILDANADPLSMEEVTDRYRGPIEFNGMPYELWAVPKKAQAFSEDDLGWMEFMAAPFSVYGGKKFLAKKIANVICDHKRYVEAFAGAAGIMFARDDSSDEEILTDIDDDKIFALQFLKGHTERDRSNLRKMDWIGRKSKFQAVASSNPSGNSSRFHKWMYTTWNSFGGRRDSYANHKTFGTNHQNYIDNRMPRYKERLQNVSIHKMDWAESVRKYDSPNTFFYLDPPYIGTSNARAKHFDEPSARDLAKVIAPIKGKWILSNTDVPELRFAFKGFSIKKVMVPTRVDQMHKNSIRERAEVLISNYELPQKIAATEDFPFEMLIGETQ